MNEWARDLDPDVKQVLLDVAKDERSTLFKVTPRDVAVGALEDVPSVSAGTAGWTPAERHLIEAYREEVSLLLRNAFRAKVRADEYASSLFLEDAPSDIGRDRLIHHQRVREDARRLAGLKGFSDLENSIRRLLGDLDKHQTAIAPTFGQLALASLRLERSDVTLVFQAAGSTIRGEYEDAITILERVTAHITRPLVRTCAWANLGLARSLAGDSGGALQAYKVASRLDPGDLSFAANTFLQALETGDPFAARSAAERIEATTSAGDAVSRFISMLRTQMARGQLVLSGNWSDTLRSIESGLGPVTMSIVHEIPPKGSGTGRLPPVHLEQRYFQHTR